MWQVSWAAPNYIAKHILKHAYFYFILFQLVFNDLHLYDA